MSYSMSKNSITAKVKAVKMSMVMTDRNIDVLHKKATRTKHILTGEDDNVAEQLRTAYYRLLAEYKYDKTFVTCYNNKPANEISLWNKVAIKCNKSELTPTNYIKAQFQWFHAVFGTYPKLSQLGTNDALKRAELYEETQSKITSSVLPHKQNLATLLKNADKQMQLLCAARGYTRSEVYKYLVKPGLFLFPKEYLDADPEYRNS